MSSCHLGVGPFPYDFVFSSILGLFPRAEEDYLFESKVVNLIRFIFQVQDNGAYPLGLNDPPNSIDFCIVLFS